MKPVEWTVLGLVGLGFAWPGAWLLAALVYEFGVRSGRDVAAFWASGHLHRGRGEGIGWHDDVD